MERTASANPYIVDDNVTADSSENGQNDFLKGMVNDAERAAYRARNDY